MIEVIDASTEPRVGEDKLFPLMEHAHSMGLYVSVMRRSDCYRAFGYLTDHTHALYVDHLQSPATALTALLKGAIARIEAREEGWRR